MANDEPEVEPAREEEEEAQEEEEQEAQEEEEAAEQEEEEDSEAQESEHEPDIIVEHTDENVKNLVRNDTRARPEIDGYVKLSFFSLSFLLIDTTSRLSFPGVYRRSRPAWQRPAGSRPFGISPGPPAPSPRHVKSQAWTPTSCSSPTCTSNAPPCGPTKSRTCARDPRRSRSVLRCMTGTRTTWPKWYAQEITACFAPMTPFTKMRTLCTSRVF